MEWSWLTNIFGYFYNFFMGIYHALNVPANALGSSWSFYNPYLDTYFVSFTPPIISNILDKLSDLLVDWWADPVLSQLGIDSSAPVWAVLLSFLPLIILSVFFVRILIKHID